MNEEEIINGLKYIKKVLIIDSKQYSMVQDPRVKLYEKILVLNNKRIRIAYSKKEELESYFIQNVNYNIRLDKRDRKKLLNINENFNYNNKGLSKILYEVNEELFKNTRIY